MYSYGKKNKKETNPINNKILKTQNMARKIEKLQFDHLNDPERLKFEMQSTEILIVRPFYINHANFVPFQVRKFKSAFFGQ